MLCLPRSQLEYKSTQHVKNWHSTKRYKCLPSKYCHPLLFWNENAVAYPLLSSVARRILGISASSAQSERDFSSVGRTMTDARARLSAAKVEAIELVRWGLRASLISSLS